ncbi:MAG: 3-isopropylmalate dehydratase small subunit [Candidatus Neomarinimicrobiota bacterium]|jgi:3-isopropylmalate/(R)-2-methylmalate dehydratase small subunit|nr:3-isopropylmalate dehydratase small subunit [Candidatus Neomarinimicrobiota bacterium]MDD3965515.1 3-isopropylmalate dehydratase small subunit [Candidatus Neomarinimicrobiota bacterium]MDX9780382.1 3-isopropylmalate dehydratase small subunit [bacterium]
MKAHVYPRNDINTDEIIPARYLNMDREEDLAAHAMEDIDPKFVKKVSEGDLIIAGENFGCGSSREHAVWALRGAGIRAVVADSFARIFYRNCINNGFLAIECPGISEMIDDSSEIEIDLKSAEIIELRSGKRYPFKPFPEFVKAMISAGGLMKKVRQQLAEKGLA